MSVFKGGNFENDAKPAQWVRAEQVQTNSHTHSLSHQGGLSKLSAYVIVPCSAFLLLSSAVSCCHRLLCFCRWLLPYEVMQCHRKASIHLWAVIGPYSVLPCNIYLANHLWGTYLLARLCGGCHCRLRVRKICMFRPSLALSSPLFLCFLQVLRFPPKSKELSSQRRLFCFDI